MAVLIKDFETAKQRLSPVLDAGARRRLARRNASRALEAALAAGPVLAVAGSPQAAELAASAGAQVLLEPDPKGQNSAARRAIDWALSAGAAEILLLSSDLPLVTSEAVVGMLAAGRRLPGPAAVAAPALGRGGTNALYMRPPDALALHFGEDSLARFEREAASRAVTFQVHESEALALDLDEPDDLARLPSAAVV